MGLSQVLGSALAGLQATQAALTVTAANVANVDTPGYIEKVSNQVETVAGNSIGVDVTGVNRELNTQVQSQLWTEGSGAGYADQLAQLYTQLQQVYGAPGSSDAVDSAFNSLTTALQSLASNPSSYSAQAGVVSAAQSVAQNLNSMSSSIQSLRTQCEQGIVQDVSQANTALQQIANVNSQLSGSNPTDASSASLKDEQDQAITQLAQLMDIRVVQNTNGEVSVFTSSGTQLVGNSGASQLTFDNRGSLSATSLLNADPAESGVGNITLVSSGGSTTNLTANNAIKSGQIAAYLQMRDRILPQAQTQLDQLAAQMSEGLSNVTTQGTAVTSGNQSGYGVDVGSLLAGNSVQVTYTDTATNTQRTLTIVNVTDPSALPLKDTSSSSPNDQVIGVNLSGGLGAAVSQLNSALGGTLQFSNPSGTTLQILNGTIGSAVVNSASITSTATGLTSGSAQLPLFVDGTSLITGAITGAGSQDTGLAARIRVNPAVVSDPSGVVNYQASTQAGDATRPSFRN
jgi:flagellar hook-associated protein 1 FlgK